MDKASPRSRYRFLLMVVVPVAAIILAVVWYYRGGQIVSTENAYVKSHIIAISTDESGRTVAVNITDNQSVSKGDILFQLDSAPFELMAAEARAQLDLVRSDVETLRAEFKETDIDVAEAVNRVQYLTRQLERQKTMKKRGIGSAQTLDEARFELQSALQRVDVLTQRNNRKLVSFGGDPALPVEKHPAYASAQVQLDLALTELAKTTVKAPANGIVSNVQLQAGEYVEAGKAIFSLIEMDQTWVEANLKESQLTNVQVGQQATLVVDAYPDLQWRARVASIAPATGAQFSVLPPQNASGNWVKVVQRIPVTLTVDRPENSPVLRAGMTVSARIDTKQRRKLPGLLQAVFGRSAETEPGILSRANAAE